MKAHWKISTSGILFDLDGVLIDSTHLVVAHWKTFSEWYSLDWAEFSQHIHGHRATDVIRRSLSGHSEDEIAVAINKFVELEEQDCEGTVQIDGAEKLLESIPIDKWAIVTSCGRQLAYNRMKTAGITPPKLLVTADDVKMGKPDPEGYLAGAALLGMKASNCVVFEDAPTGLQAAIASGATPIAVGNTLPEAELIAALGENGLLAPRLTDLSVSGDGGSLTISHLDLEG